MEFGDQIERNHGRDPPARVAVTDELVSGLPVRTAALEGASVVPVRGLELVLKHVLPFRSNGFGLGPAAPSLALTISRRLRSFVMAAPHVDREQAKRLFLHQLKELDRLSERGGDDQERVVDLGRVLGLLLLDGLVHQVNRDYKVKLKFAVRGRTAFQEAIDALGPSFTMSFDGLDPNTALVPGPTLDLNLDGFLGHEAGRVDELTVTVRDVIAQVRSSHGGVHVGPPEKGEARKALYAFEQGMRIGGYTPSVSAIFAIGRVTRKSLEPLRAAVERS